MHVSLRMDMGMGMDVIMMVIVMMAVRRAGGMQRGVRGLVEVAMVLKSFDGPLTATANRTHGRSPVRCDA